MSAAIGSCLAFVLSLSPLSVSAQRRTVEQVKKNISVLTPTIDSYKKALQLLAPALEHEETRDRAETWALAARIDFELYDRYDETRRVGKTIPVHDMYGSLLDAFDYSHRALALDTVWKVDKNGQPRIDRKTGKQEFKTHHSKEVVARLHDHVPDYRMAANTYYNDHDWSNAIKAWDCYLALVPALPDTTRGELRFFQGVAAWQNGEHRKAVELFDEARSLGYDHKDAYDYALICLSELGDDEGIVALSAKAYDRYGTSDPQYVRILINDYISKGHLELADLLLDQAIAANDSDDEAFNLKGLVVEQRLGIEKALPYFEKCIAIAPDNARGLYNVGRYYYNRATSLADQNPTLHGRALARIVNPVYEQALPYLERAYELDPGNDDARNALRNIYYQLGMGAKLQAIERNR